MEKANLLYLKLVAVANRINDLRESNSRQTINMHVQPSKSAHLNPPHHSNALKYFVDSVADCFEYSAHRDFAGITPAIIANSITVSDLVTDHNVYGSCENTDLKNGNCNLKNLSVREYLPSQPSVIDSDHLLSSANRGLLSTADVPAAKAVCASNLERPSASCNIVSPAFVPSVTNILRSDYNSCLKERNCDATHVQNEAFGWKLPDDTTFMDIYLDSALNQKKTDTTNYLYYLYDAPNTMDTGSGSMDYVHVEFGSTDDTIELDVDDYEVFAESAGFESMDYEPIELGSTDDTIELDVVNYDVDYESSNVIDTENNTSDPFNSRRQSMTHTNDETPWKIVIKQNKGCDDTDMFVPVSGPTAKPLCCIYCLKRYPKLARHLLTVHKDEADVKEFIGLPIGSKERKQAICMIMRRGMFEWNGDPKLNGGEMQTCRRPNEKFERPVTYFTPCPKCLGSFTEKTLSRHFKICSNNALQGERKVKQLSRAVDGRLHPNASADLNKVFSKLQADPVVRPIRFDWLLIEFANGLCLNYHPFFQQKMIRDKLRSAGKVLVTAKSLSPAITDFSSLYHVKHCTVVIEAVRKVAKFDLGAKSFGSPGTATTLVTLIKAIGETLLIEYMKSDNPVDEKNVERFLMVFTKDAKLKINKLAALTQKRARRSRKDDIPSTDDVSRFAAYLDCELETAFADLQQEYTYKNWVHLSEVTLAAILVYNRKRTGEMRNILVSEYHSREMLASFRDSLVAGNIPEATIKLIRSRITARGKLERDVPVLLKHKYDDSIDILLRHRTDARISDENKFLFALYSAAGEETTVNSCVVIQKFSNKCDAQNPGSLRGTKLRKHLASICGTMNLNDPEVTNVAQFMGHDTEIHRNIYRQNSLRSQVVQMAEILERAQGKMVNISSSSEESGNVTAEAVTMKNKRIRAPKPKAGKIDTSKVETQKNTRKTVVTTKKQPKSKVSITDEPSSRGDPTHIIISKQSSTGIGPAHINKSKESSTDIGPAYSEKSKQRSDGIGPAHINKSKESSTDIGPAYSEKSKQRSDGIGSAHIIKSKHSSTGTNKSS